MPFQKGNQLAKGGSGPFRRDPTIELVTQLNELIKNYDGTKRTKLHRLIKNRRHLLIRGSAPSRGSSGGRRRGRAALPVRSTVWPPQDHPRMLG